MIRKLLNISLLSLLVLATIWLGFHFFQRISNPERELIAAVPEDAAVVIQISDPVSLWKQLNASSLLWSELKSISPFRQTHRSMLMCDSLIQYDNEFSTLFGDRQLCLSLHVSGTGAIELLLTGRLPDQDPEHILKKIESIAGPATERAFKTDKIYTIQLGGQSWMLLMKNGFITLSSTPSMSEKTAMHLDSESSLTQKAEWISIYRTADPSAQANIFIQHSYFSRLLGQWANSDQLPLLAQMDPFAQWTELDLSLKANTVSLNGFSQIADSLPSLLHLFSEHEARPFQAARFLPDQTSAFLWVAMNDGESFRRSVDNYRKAKGTLNEYQLSINRFNADFDCNLERQLCSWIGNEMVLFSSGKPDSSRTENLFLVIHINDTGDPITELNALSGQLDTNANRTRDENGTRMKRIMGEDLFALMFGEIFAGIDNPWYIRVEDYMIFANSGNALQTYLQNISSDKTLGKNITYYNFVSENLSDRSNFTVYVNPSKFIASVPQFFNEGLSASLAGPSTLLNKFDAFAWQISTTGKGNYYNNLYLKYSGEGREDSKSLWEVAVDTTVTMKPLLVKNHISGATDLLVQDENYKIYLISSKGEISWKKQLDERMTGDLRQIDFFGNGKLQLLFTTSSSLHLIDLKGNYLKGFPLALKNEVSGNMGVFDYEGNNNYRFLIPTGKNIVNIDKEGKFITGWEPDVPGGSITQAPVFFRCENKDYLFLCDKNGELRFIDRKGKIRYNINFDLKNRSQNPVVLEPGSSIEGTALVWSDSSGRILRTYLNGKTDTAKTGLQSSTHRFALGDANENGKKDIILLDSGRIRLFEWSGQLLGDYHFSDRILNEILLFQLKDGSLKIGAVAPGLGEIYLLDGNGQMHSRFPLQGSTAFPLGDINGDGSLEVISGTGTRRIVCYSLK